MCKMHLSSRPSLRNIETHNEVFLPTQKDNFAAAICSDCAGRESKRPNDVGQRRVGQDPFARREISHCKGIARRPFWAIVIVAININGRRIIFTRETILCPAAEDTQALLRNEHCPTGPTCDAPCAVKEHFPPNQSGEIDAYEVRR